VSSRTPRPVALPGSPRAPARIRARGARSRATGVLLLAAAAALAACGKGGEKEAASSSAAAKTYACPMDCENGKTYPEKGKCPVCGMALEEVVHGKLAHSDHTPQKGGQFIMAEDNWHHVEGTLPAMDRFVLWTYDQFTEPLPLGKTLGTARVTVKPRTGSTPAEYAEVPMVAGPEGTSLVAALPAGLAFPVSVRAVVTFEGKSPFTFDFRFKELSVAPPPGSVKPHRHTHAGGAHGVADDRPVPADRPAILKALEEARVEATGLADAGKLADLHRTADRIGKLAAALSKAGGGEGRLARLATDLDAQGDSGNAAGVREVLTEIGKDVAAAGR
jgi:hypothetical protein